MNKRSLFILVSFLIIVFVVTVIAQSPKPAPPVTWWYKVANWIETGTITFTNKTLTSPTIDGIATMDSVAVDSLNVSGQLVMATTAPIYLRDATEQIYSSVNGQLDIDATTEVEITTGTLDLNGALDVSGSITMAGGATVSNVTDTLSLDETVVNIGGALTVGTDPSQGITAITQFATASGAERASITIGGVEYLLVAVADSADIVD